MLGQHLNADEPIKLESLTTTDGTKYSNVTVTKITGDTIRFMHSDGINSVSINIVKKDPSSMQLFEKVEQLAKQDQLIKEKREHEERANQLRIQEQQANEMQSIRQLIAENKPIKIDIWKKLLEGKDMSQVRDLLGPPNNVTDTALSWMGQTTRDDFRTKWTYADKAIDSDSGARVYMYIYFEQKPNGKVREVMDDR